MSADETTQEGTDIRISVSEIDAAHRALDIEVPAEQVTAEYEKACRKYARNLTVPGFRKGKVPPHIIKQRFGKEIEQETVEHAIEHAMREAVQQARPRPLRPPVLKEYDYAPGKVLTFKAEYEVMPQVKVAGVDRVEVTVAEPMVTDQMVSETLTSLREQAARFDPVEGRGVATGDHIVCDASAHEIPGGAKAFEREHAMLEIGSGGPYPELTEPLRGMEPGQTREFEVNYPEDHPSREVAGKRLSYKMTLREIKQKVLPEIDDEFARDLGKFETLEELKRKINEDLMSRERRRVREEARQKVIEHLLDSNPEIAVPDVLIEDEVDRRVQEIARSMAMQGMDPRERAIDWDEIRRKQGEPARRTVRASILLDAIAEEQNIALDPESLDKAIETEAQRRRQTPEALRAQLKKDGRLDALSEHLRREKVLDFLLGASNT